MSAFIRYDQLPSLSVVPDDALVAVWNAGKLYAAPRSAVGSGAGGSGFYQTFQLNGVSVTQRSTLNVTGLLSLVDSGGKSVLSLAAIALASQVAGILPLANGGTGAALSGTPLQAVRLNAGGTALELYTPSSGLNAPVNPTDNAKVAVASGGNLSYLLLGSANLSPSAGIALTQLANIAANRLLGSIGGGAPAELTVGGGVEFTGSGIQSSAFTGDVTKAAGGTATSIAAKAVTLAKLADAAAKGQSSFFNGSSWVNYGVKTRATDLPDSDTTLSLTDGSRAELNGALTNNRVGTFNLTGIDATYGRDTYVIERRDGAAFTYTVKNSLGITIYVFPADGVKRLAAFQIVGGEWNLASQALIT